MLEAKLDDEPWMKANILIPAHNEGRRIGRCLETLTNIYPSTEIIVSEDGSSDDTLEVARGFDVVILHTKRRLGKWGGIKRGLDYCGEQYTIITDADLSVSPYVFPIALNVLMNGAHVVLGDRISRNGPVHRMIFGKSFHVLVRLLYNMPYDTQTSLIAVNSAAARRVLEPLTVNHFAHAIAFLDACRKHGLKIRQVPVIWTYYPESSVNLARDIPLMLKDMLSQRFRFT